jgi:protein-S-isoprenylcysteine O-methyltransferase Ste14
MFPFTALIVVCWIIFWVYWLIASFGSKRSIGPGIRRFAGVRITIFAIMVLLFRFHAVHKPSSLTSLDGHNEWVTAIGFIVFLAGLSLAVWARVFLGKNWGMPMTQKQNPELITDGPYHYIRHPIYSGILLAMIGCAVASSLFWLIIFFIAGAYFIYSAITEEEIMSKKFPEAYPRYKAKTKMLIPFLF